MSTLVRWFPTSMHSGGHIFSGWGYGGFPKTRGYRPLSREFLVSVSLPLPPTPPTNFGRFVFQARCFNRNGTQRAAARPAVGTRQDFSSKWQTQKRVAFHSRRLTTFKPGLELVPFGLRSMRFIPGPSVQPPSSDGRKDTRMSMIRACESEYPE